MGKKKTSKRVAPKKHSAQKKKIITKRRSQESDGDIIQLILQDHKPLKKLIKTIKNTGKAIDERRSAFEEFAKLLTVHSISEEQVLYSDLKRRKEKLEQKGYEGEVENSVAQEMIEKTKESYENTHEWSASAKVLAEFVEHHIDEEEDHLLKKFRKSSSADERFNLGNEYLAKKAECEGQDGIPEDYFYTYSRSLAQ